MTQMYLQKLGKRKTVLIQQDLNMIYKLTDDNLMQFNEIKFEQMSHEDTRNVGKGLYKIR